MEGPTGDVYNEEAFRHFVGLERKRAEHSNRMFLLLLVSLKGEPAAATRFAPYAAARLFAGLAQCVREVDFIGWYRDGRVAGAVLTQRSGSLFPVGAAVDRNISRAIADRVMLVLSDKLPARVAQRLRIRVVRVRRRSAC